MTETFWAVFECFVLSVCVGLGTFLIRGSRTTAVECGTITYRFFIVSFLIEIYRSLYV